MQILLKSTETIDIKWTFVQTFHNVDRLISQNSSIMTKSVLENVGLAYSTVH